jgi:hypothetical protein
MGLFCYSALRSAPLTAHGIEPPTILTHLLLYPALPVSVGALDAPTDSRRHSCDKIVHAVDGRQLQIKGPTAALWQEGSRQYSRHRTLPFLASSSIFRLSFSASPSTSCSTNRVVFFFDPGGRPGFPGWNGRPRTLDGRSKAFDRRRRIMVISNKSTFPT